VSLSFHARNWTLALALLAWPALTQANIGDDLSQLRQRFGSASVVGSQMLFQHDGYSICVYFDGIHAGMEVFVRDGSDPKKTDITQQDIDKILSDEGAGQPWTPVQVPSGKPTWIRADGKLLARLSVGDKADDKYLTIMSNTK